MPHTTENTEISTWFERDRANITLTDGDGNELLSLWDDEVQEAIEDGFISTKAFVMGRLVSEDRLHADVLEMVNGR